MQLCYSVEEGENATTVCFVLKRISSIVTLLVTSLIKWSFFKFMGEKWSKSLVSARPPTIRLSDSVLSKAGMTAKDLSSIKLHVCAVTSTYKSCLPQ